MEMHAEKGISQEVVYFQEDVNVARFSQRNRVTVCHYIRNQEASRTTAQK